MYLVPILCALTGALFLALGSERQASGVRALERGDGARPGRGGALRLLTSPVWLVGGVLMLAGIVLNVIALAWAPLTVVQPLGAVAVVVTTLVHARVAGLRVDPATWRAVAACTLGSVAFVLITVQATRPNPVPEADQETLTAWITAGVVAAGLVAALALRGRRSALVPIVAAGVLYGFVAVCVRMSAVRLVDGRPPAWGVLAVLVAGAVLGVWFVQTAYRHGPPDLVVAGLTVVDPMVGVLVGVLVLGEMRPDAPWWVGPCLLAAAAVATVGIVRLSRSHPDVLARREERRVADTPGETTP